MIDAIDELVAHSKNHRELRAFHEFHKTHPEVLDFLVREIQLRIEPGFAAFSYHSLWEYARWKIELENGPSNTFLMNDHAAPFYARAITILHPEFNGRAEFRRSTADLVFGTDVQSRSRRGGPRAMRGVCNGRTAPQLKTDGGPSIPTHLPML